MRWVLPARSPIVFSSWMKGSLSRKAHRSISSRTRPIPEHNSSFPRFFTNSPQFCSCYNQTRCFSNRKVVTVLLASPEQSVRLAHPGAAVVAVGLLLGRGGRPAGREQASPAAAPRRRGSSRPPAQPPARGATWARPDRPGGRQQHRERGRLDPGGGAVCAVAGSRPGPLAGGGGDDGGPADCG